MLYIGVTKQTSTKNVPTYAALSAYSPVISDGPRLTSNVKSAIRK